VSATATGLPPTYACALFRQRDASPTHVLSELAASVDSIEHAKSLCWLTIGMPQRYARPLELLSGISFAQGTLLTLAVPQEHALEWLPERVASSVKS